MECATSVFCAKKVRLLTAVKFLPMGENSAPDAREMMETRFYRSALKQTVQFLNSQLPAVRAEQVQKEDGQRSSEPKQRGEHRDQTYKSMSVKKTSRAMIEEVGGVSVADVRPSRVKKALKEPEVREGRVNKYTARRLEEIRMRGADGRRGSDKDENTESGPKGRLDARRSTATKQAGSKNRQNTRFSDRIGAKKPFAKHSVKGRRNK